MAKFYYEFSDGAVLTLSDTEPTMISCGAKRNLTDRDPQERSLTSAKYETTLFHLASQVFHYDGNAWTEYIYADSNCRPPPNFQVKLTDHYFRRMMHEWVLHSWVAYMLGHFNWSLYKPKHILYVFARKHQGFKFSAYDVARHMMTYRGGTSLPYKFLTADGRIHSLLLLTLQFWGQEAYPQSFELTD
jgi:hypothetical protein